MEPEGASLRKFVAFEPGSAAVQRSGEDETDAIWILVWLDEWGQKET